MSAQCFREFLELPFKVRLTVFQKSDRGEVVKLFGIRIPAINPKCSNGFHAVVGEQIQGSFRGRKFNVRNRFAFKGRQVLTTRCKALAAVDIAAYTFVLNG